MPRILLVEDEKDIRSLYAQYLKESGYEVLEAEDGLKGLELALEGNWDIMLLDIMLPSQDGIAVLKKIKSAPNIMDKPVIALTNLWLDSVINEMFDIGIDSYLIKSEITPDKIVAEVEAVLQKYL